MLTVRLLSKLEKLMNTVIFHIYMADHHIVGFRRRRGRPGAILKSGISGPIPKKQIGPSEVI